MKTLYITILCSLITVSAFAQQESEKVRNGNKLYNEQKYADAENAYRDALKKNSKSFEASYNLGNALYKQNKYPEALNAYKQALGSGRDPRKVAAALHNLGNSMMQQKQYDHALEAYKQALLANPNDNETRFNYAFAKAMLKKNNDKNNNKNNKNQQNKDQQKQPNNNPNNQNKNNNQQQQQQPQPSGMSKENADQILNSIQESEKQVQDKLNEKKVKVHRPNPEKDW
jgi:tetratricopeptide (TPR) repeat protein